MKKMVTKTGVYTIYVSTEKNRLYITLLGFWLSPSVATSYVEDILKGIQFLSSPFTVLVDLRDMQTPGHLLKDIHIEAQKAVIDAGCIKSAEVIPERISLKLELEDYASDSLIVRKTFKNIDSAEIWLDSPLD